MQPWSTKATLFFWSSSLGLTRLRHLLLPAGQGPGKCQWSLRKWEVRVEEKEVPIRAQERDARKWWAEREICRSGRTVMSYQSLCSLRLAWCDFHCSGNSTNRGAGRELSLGIQQVKECKKTPRWRDAPGLGFSDLKNTKVLGKDCVLKGCEWLDAMERKVVLWLHQETSLGIKCSALKV